MGKAMVIYQIYPKEKYDLAKLVDDLSKIEKVKGVQREPIAFGLEVVKVGALIDDKRDRPQETEDKIKKTPGVKQVETLDVTLIS